MLTGQCTIHGYLEGGRYTLAVDGELDMITAPMLEAAAGVITTNDADQLVLDLRGVRFIDSTAIRALLLAKDICDEHGRGLSVVLDGSSRIAHTLEIAGVLGLLSCTDLITAPACDPVLYWAEPLRAAL